VSKVLLTVSKGDKKKNPFLSCYHKEMAFYYCVYKTNGTPREPTHVLGMSYFSLERLSHQKQEKVDFYLVCSMDSVSLGKQRMEFPCPLLYTI